MFETPQPPKPIYPSLPSPTSTLTKPEKMTHQRLLSFEKRPS